MTSRVTRRLVHPQRALPRNGRARNARVEREAQCFSYEFSDAEPNTFDELIAERRTVTVLSQDTDGQLDRAARYRELLRGYGCTDELRAVLWVDEQPWGSAVLYGRERRFTSEDAARPAQVATMLVDAYGRTPRQREVLGLLLLGRSMTQIARQLGIFEHTANDHRKAIYSRVGVTSRGELAARLEAEQHEPRSRAGVTPSPYGGFLDG